MAWNSVHCGSRTRFIKAEEQLIQNAWQYDETWCGKGCR